MFFLKKLRIFNSIKQNIINNNKSNFYNENPIQYFEAKFNKKFDKTGLSGTKLNVVVDLSKNAISVYPSTSLPDNLRLFFARYLGPIKDFNIRKTNDNTVAISIKFDRINLVFHSVNDCNNFIEATIYPYIK